jgi:hypothetical protein
VIAATITVTAVTAVAIVETANGWFMINVWCRRWLFSVVVVAIVVLSLSIEHAHHTAGIALFALLVLLLPVSTAAAAAVVTFATTSPTAIATPPRGQVGYTSRALWT